MNFIMLFIIFVLFGCACALNNERSFNTIHDAGSCGDNLEWVFDGETLTIKGSGDMLNFSEWQTPWYGHVDTIKSVVIEEGVSSIGSYAFSWCSSLKSVIIPTSVTAIWLKAFYQCPNITVIDIPSGVTTIGNYAIQTCESLTHVFVSSTVTTIGSYAFKKCPSLLAIEVDKNNAKYASIDGVLFNKKCSSLIHYPSGKQNSSYTIPKSVTSISIRTFNDSSFLESFEVEEGNEQFSAIDGVLFDKTGTVLIRYPSGNPNTNYTVPKQVTSIRERSFSNCGNLLNVTLVDGMITIGSFAFEDCTNLVSVRIPATVTSIGSGAFLTGPNLKTIDVDDGNVYYSSVDGVLFNHEKDTIIQYPSGRTGKCVIPEYVKSIGDCAFQRCLLSSITISDTVVTIGADSFRLCRRLSHLVFGKNLTTIGSGAFFGDNALVNVVIPDNVVSIGSTAFSYCQRLEAVFYQGSTAMTENDVFSTSLLLRKICVSPEYESSTFGGVKVTSSNETCQQFRSMFNHCFEGTFADGSVAQQKRLNATIAESQSYGCVHFQCVNESGEITRNLLCEERECETSECDTNDGVCKYKIVDGRDELIENHCFEVACDGNKWVLQKRSNVTEYEEQTTECFAYRCNNESGGIVESLCKSGADEKQTCINQQCVDESSLRNEEGWYVELEVDVPIRVYVNVADFAPNLSIISGVTPNDVKVQTTLDGDNGYRIRIVLFVKDEETAKVVAKKTSVLLTSDDCEYGVLCNAKNIQITETRVFSSVVLSSAFNDYLSVHDFVIVLLVFLLSIRNI